MHLQSHTHIYAHTGNQAAAYGRRDGKDLRRWHFHDDLLLRNAAAGASGAAQRERTQGGGGWATRGGGNGKEWVGGWGGLVGLRGARLLP